jgi:hypothetical protein
MMYGNKLAAAIKVNGKVLREFKDTVYIPFGSEYAITLRNLHTTRCVVDVYIDGDNMVPGGLVLNPSQSIDLERSIRNNNLTEGNRFKFIERTEKIENHRGIGVEDGLVRIEYKFELPPLNINSVLRGIDKGWITASGASGSTYSSVSPTSATLNSIQCSTNAYVSDAGITVPGSKSTQSFTTTYMGAMDPTTHNLVFRLVGDLGNNKPVDKPVTVKRKVKCTTCGHQNKATAKFCVECGTALEIFA